MSTMTDRRKRKVAHIAEIAALDGVIVKNRCGAHLTDETLGRSLRRLIESRKDVYVLTADQIASMTKR